MAFDERVVMGDSHSGGKSVELVKDNSSEYIRKPRNAAVEHALEAFLLGLRQEGFVFTPRCVKILDEGSDWHNAEIVKNDAAESIDDVILYCRRCGALIFIAYILGSTDLHIENVIASKDSPVLVDVETLLSGRVNDGTPHVKHNTLTQSVLKSHLLPNWIASNGAVADCGGLTGFNDNSRNILTYNGENVYIYDFEREVLEGFTEVYSFALSHKEKLLTLTGLFSGCGFRQILRPTETYARISELVRKLDADKAKRFTEALLRRAYENDTDPDRLRKAYLVFRSEVNSILRGDIPYFYSLGCSTDLCDENGKVLEGFLLDSPVMSAKKRIGSLSAEDMECQRRIISQSLSAVRPVGKRLAQPVCGESIYDIIINTLESRSLSSITSRWMALRPSGDGNVYLQSAGLGLYDGLLGILCCYAAVYNKTGNKDTLRKLKEHYEPCRRLITEKRTVVTSLMGCSVQNGFSGHILSLIHISELTGEKLFYDDAVKIASDVTVDLSGKSDIGDLLCGALGIALCLPKLPKEVYEGLAKLLLPNLISYEPKLTGVAHGASGAALALAAVQKALGTTLYDDKIISLLEYENSFYDKGENNWRDLRNPQKNGFMDGWCSGAPGIGMSRRRIEEYTDNEVIVRICRKDIGNITKRLLAQKSSKRDCLCCGNASKIMAGSYLGVNIPDIYKGLESRLKCDILNAVHPIDTCDINSGLMQGFAGTGYALAMYGDKHSGGMLL